MVFLMFCAVAAFVMLCNHHDDRAKRKAKEKELASKEARNPQAITASNNVDMTPPVLAQPTISNDQASKPKSVSVVVEAEATVEKVSDTTLSTVVPKADSQPSRKGTANDPATWACKVSFFGKRHASAPQAVRSADPRRKEIAARLREEAIAADKVARMAAAKRASKFKARLKKLRAAQKEAAEMEEEAALLAHHLAAEGVIC